MGSKLSTVVMSRGALLNCADAVATRNEGMFTLKMSSDYRVYTDEWRSNPAIKNELSAPVEQQLKLEFRQCQGILDDIRELLERQKVSPETMSELVMKDMATAVFGGNAVERAGVSDLNETLRLCKAIFRGEEGLEVEER